MNPRLEHRLPEPQDRPRCYHDRDLRPKAGAPLQGLSKEPLLRNRCERPLPSPTTPPSPMCFSPSTKAIKGDLRATEGVKLKETIFAGNDLINAGIVNVRSMKALLWNAEREARESSPLFAAAAVGLDMQAKELAARAFSARYEDLKISHAEALRVNGQRKKTLVEGGTQDADDPVGHTLAAMLAHMGFRESLAVAHHASFGENGGGCHGERHAGG